MVLVFFDSRARAQRMASSGVVTTRPHSTTSVNTPKFGLRLKCLDS